MKESDKLKLCQYIGMIKCLQQDKVQQKQNIAYQFPQECHKNCKNMIQKYIKSLSKNRIENAKKKLADQLTQHFDQTAIFSNCFIQFILWICLIITSLYNIMQKSQANPPNSKSEPDRKKITFQKVPIYAQIFAGFASGFLVSPFNTIVDKSVIENANGKTPLWRGVANGLKDLFTKPQIFLKTFEFRWLLLVYTSTYISSNLADHVSIKGIDPSILKLGITFVVNTVTSLAKDRALTQKFGTKQAKSFPITSFGLFFLRDIIAMASAFTIPPILGQIISEQFNIEQKNGLRIAQIISPLLVQFVGTPLHLLGLDWYNNEGSTIGQRMQFLKKVYVSSLIVRMLRFLPTYGIGGIVNFEIRNHFMEKDQKN